MIFGDFHWTVLLAAIPAFYLQLAVHEISHVLVARKLGYEGVRWWVYPFPKRRILGGWMLSGFMYQYGLGKRSGNEWKMWVAPPRWSLSVFIFMGFVGVFCTWYAVPTAVFALIDSIWFWKGYFFGSEHTDGARYRILKEQSDAQEF
jgi:hypothetical protein